MRLAEISCQEMEGADELEMKKVAGEMDSADVLEKLAEPDVADAGSGTDLRIGDPQTDQAPLGTSRSSNTNQVESRKSLRCSWHPSDDDYVRTFYLDNSLGVAGGGGGVSGVSGGTKTDRAKVNQTVRISSWDLRELPLKVARMDVLSDSGFGIPGTRRSTPNIVTAVDNHIDNYFDIVVKELRGGFVAFH